MEKVLFSPACWCSARRMRTHAEWNVDTHISRARGPTSAATRSFISPAALFVNVIAMIWPGCAPRSARRYAIRWVSTRVLPEPAPATISNGDPACVTASRCGPFSPDSNVSGSCLRARRGWAGCGAFSGETRIAGASLCRPTDEIVRGDVAVTAVDAGGCERRRSATRSGDHNHGPLATAGPEGTASHRRAGRRPGHHRRAAGYSSDRRATGDREGPVPVLQRLPRRHRPADRQRRGGERRGQPPSGRRRRVTRHVTETAPPRGPRR